MSEPDEVIVSRHSKPHGSYTSYTIGFLLSITLTIVAYLLSTHHATTTQRLAFVVGGLAILQFAVQLLFFLHLGRETKPRWKLLVFGFMIMVVSIVAFGSLWIMYNLNYRMTIRSTTEVNKYLDDQDSL
jgi:cytochrome o ubiquinol oxidase operon protein cyoD